VNFEPKTPGSIWTLSGSPAILRLNSCPVGFALIRRESNDQGDTCEPCPVETYSLNEAKWTGNESESGLAFFCHNCPRGAKCLGGSNVTATKGWWLEAETQTNAKRRTSESAKQVFKAYRCDRHCQAENKCGGGRTGVACGLCPADHVLQDTGCGNCSPGVDTDGTKIVVGLLVSGGLVLVWFLVAWAPVFGGKGAGFLSNAVKPLRWPIRAFKRARSLRKKTKALQEKTRELQSFVSNPKNLRIFQQYIKILIAYIQVTASFIVFTWPPILTLVFDSMWIIASFVNIDILDIPKLNCVWMDYSFETKYHLRMALPLVVIVLLTLPVWVAQYFQHAERRRLKRRLLDNSASSRHHSGSLPLQFQPSNMQRLIHWTARYESTVDQFWNNFMFFLFIIFPGAAYSSLEPFNCRVIASITYMKADYSERCPWATTPEQLTVGGFFYFREWNSLAIAAALYSLLYIVGTPSVMLYIMLRNKVPALSGQRISRSLMSAMIAEYMKATSTASSQRFASFLGMPLSLASSVQSDDTGSCDEEFIRRSEAMYLEIFPDHSECGASCRGHTFPQTPLKFLKELKYPENISALGIEARKWFSRIDMDKDGFLDFDELQIELLRIGLDQNTAQSIMEFHDTDSNEKLDLVEFVDMVIFTLNNALGNLHASDLAMLGRLIETHDTDKNEKLDVNEFRTLALNLIKKNFVFHGLALTSSPPPFYERVCLRWRACWLGFWLLLMECVVFWACRFFAVLFRGILWGYYFCAAFRG